MRKRNSVCWILLGLVIAAPLAFAEEQASISRLPPLPQPLDPILQDMFDKRRAMGGAVINLSPRAMPRNSPERPEPWHLRSDLRRVRPAA